MAGRRWAKETGALWHDRYDRPDRRAYPARHQFLYALWRLVDGDPENVSVEEEMLSRTLASVGKRFEEICERMADKDLALRYAYGAELAVNAAAGGKKLKANEVRQKEFTLAVFKETNRIREEWAKRSPD